MIMKIPNPVFPKDLLLRKKIRTASPLTTSSAIDRNPTVLPPATPAVKPGVQKFAYSNEGAGGGPGIPPSPKLLPISDEFQPAVGVYILAAPTASGKSVISSSLVAWSNAQGVPATYLYTFEPRCQHIISAGKQIFTKPSRYAAEVRAFVQRASAPLKLLVLDSATLGMKAFAEFMPDQATFTGGAQPSDRAFLDAISRTAYDYQTCIITVLNSTLVPYVASLEGAVEGLLTINSIKSMGIRDRTAYSGRKSHAIEIPIKFVSATLVEWGLGEYRAGGLRTGTRGSFLGL